MKNIPLAELMRPKKLSDFIGQEHLTGKDGIISKLLSNQVANNYMPSLILWGPPGCGKTTLARIIANSLKREFYEFSAVNTSSKIIQNIMNNVSSGKHVSSSMYQVSKNGKNGSSTQREMNTPHPSGEFLPPIVFLDEIHRFNKAQQDRLLPNVERGDIILIGATTENPSFEVIGPLLSRCRVIVLKQLKTQDLKLITNRALKTLKTKIDDKALEFLIESSNGDARVLLNTIEIANSLSTSLSPSLSTKKIKKPIYHIPSTILQITDIETALQRHQLSFDKQGDEFYNVISAFIKSMRASNVDAALYYLARMVAAGQDPLYIARRMVVFASEDVASPTALVVANAVFQACHQIGYPECQENLAAGVVYLATAKKDRSAYEAYMKALGDVQRFGNLPIPMKILNSPTKLMKELGYGSGYEMYGKDSLLPEKLKGKKYNNKS